MADKVDIDLIPVVDPSAVKSITDTFALATEKSLGDSVYKAFSDGMEKAARETPPPIPAPTPIKAKEKDAPAAGGSPDTSEAAGAAGGLSGALGGITAAFSAVTAGVSAAVGALMGFVDFVKGFVEIANPAVVEQFNIVMKDMQGVVGQTLTPVLQALIPVFRSFADAVATVLPTSGQMRDVLKTLDPALKALQNMFAKVGAQAQQVTNLFLASMMPLMDEFGKAFTEIFDALTPVMVEFVKVLAQLMPVFSFLAKVVANNIAAIAMVVSFLAKLQTAMYETVGWLLELIGLGKAPEAGQSSSSVGAASHGASAVGAEEMGRSAMIAAFGGPTSPAERSASALDEIKSDVAAIRQFIVTARETAGAVGDVTRTAAASGLFGLPGMIIAALPGNS